MVLHVAFRGCSSLASLGASFLPQFAKNDSTSALSSTEVSTGSEIKSVKIDARPLSLVLISV